MSDRRIGKARAESLAAELSQLSAAYGEDLPSERWAFREAAAVLSSFNPVTLRPVGEADPDSLAISYILPDSERVVLEDGSDGWSLTELIRRRTLERLGTREAMANALAANPDRPDDPSQHALAALIEGESPELEGASPGELSGLLTAVEWLEGILPDLPSRTELRRKAGMMRFLAPLRRLVGNCFQGRESVLSELRDYVGVLPGKGFVSFVRRARRSLFDTPPMMIWGPGGVGKSTVIAKFVLDHAAVEPENRFPFVYLNFDRNALLAEEPLTLLREAARQIGLQYPETSRLVDELESWISDALASRGGAVTEVSMNEWGRYLERFGRLVEKAEPEERPLLFVLDTFEEVQYQGDERVDIVWNFVDQLQREIPHAAVVFAGRSELGKSHETDSVKLGAFDQEAATALLEGLVAQAEIDPLGADEIETLLEVVGTMPLSLQLAVGLLAKDRDVERSLRGVEGRRYFVLRAKAAKVQGQLYGRVLEHIHDPEVRKLAYPGLILRRITPEIIEEVLAGPCEVAVENRAHAERLFGELAREAALVEVAPDGALEHRRDVRRLMLGDLQDQVPEKVEEIHRSAAGYYEARSATDAHMRAEELYHRACLGADEKEIEGRWLAGVEPFLRTSLEELPPPAQLALSRLMGITPDSELLAQADLGSWEAVASKAARRQLGSGDPEGALETLAARPDRSEGSTLYALEAEALRTLDRADEAIEVAQRGIDSAEGAGALREASELLLILTLSYEANGDLGKAQEQAARAAEVAASANDTSTELRAKVAGLRLARKRSKVESRPRGPARPLGMRPRGKARPKKRKGPTAGEVEALKKEAVGKLDGLSRRELRRHPALLREAVAELGAERPELLSLSLRISGFESNVSNVEVADLLSESDTGSEGDDLAMAAGIDFGLDRKEAWSQWATKQGSGLGRAVSKLVDKVDLSNETLDSLSNQVRESVEGSFKGKS